MKELTVELVDVMERLVESVEKLAEMHAAAEERVERITATVESEREVELARRLEEAEAKIVALEAAALVGAGRKTASAAMVAKPVVAVERLEAATLDVALANLSVEQRIAVKAELLRAGAIG